MVEVYSKGYNLNSIYYMFIEAFLLNLRLGISKVSFKSRNEFQSLKRPTYDIEMMARKYATDFILKNIHMIQSLHGTEVELLFEVVDDRMIIKIKGW